MEDVLMGVTYFELDDTTGTRDQLIQFFKDLGFTLVKSESLKHEKPFERIFHFRDNDGLSFRITWYINLVHMRFGTWGKSLVECDFDRIEGAWVPFSDHLTLSLFRGKEKAATLAVARNK